MYGTGYPPQDAYGGGYPPVGFAPDPYGQPPNQQMYGTGMPPQGDGSLLPPGFSDPSQQAPAVGFPPQQYANQPTAVGYSDPSMGYAQPPPPQQPQMMQPGYQDPRMMAPPMGYVQPPQPYSQPPPSFQQPPMMQPGYGQPQMGGGYQMAPLSTGRRKALLVGINYKGSTAELRGCINDVRNVKAFLLEKGFVDSPQTMVVLTDDQMDRSRMPTRANMMAAMKWLVTGAASGDSLFFHFSGHGSQVRDTNGDEDDGFDETILPVDFQSAGQIVDDEIHDTVVKAVPLGCRLTAVFDSCHSGTAMDLPYIYDANGMIEGPGGPTMQPPAQQRIDPLQMGLGMMMGGLGGPQALSSLLGGGRMHKKQGRTSRANAAQVISAKATQGDVLMFSGCRDDQTSVDATIAGNATGAMSFAFMETIRKFPSISYQQMLVHMRDIMRGRFKQIVQLSSSHPMDMNQPFAI
eukprot:TRINITY_DN1938_c0_g1_i1.p1 TRINITY_DN1938_c0_g1~~TRINITY_DN1938_c0_g1_i1.p1  ORF type:complete len:462 (-),score=171.94 TRINITY_DN1938_c0_g1_i1:214-1599(-)